MVPWAGPSLVWQNVAIASHVLLQHSPHRSTSERGDVRAWSMYGFVHGQAMPDSHSLHINQGRAMPDSISSPTLKSQVGQCLTHRFDLLRPINRIRQQRPPATAEDTGSSKSRLAKADIRAHDRLVRPLLRKLTPPNHLRLTRLVLSPPPRRSRSRLHQQPLSRQCVHIMEAIQS